jgi:hypothetical protein
MGDADYGIDPAVSRRLAREIREVRETGVELALVGLLTVLVGMTGATAYSVAIVYRVASYWFAIAVGGIAALYVVSRT